MRLRPGAAALCLLLGCLVVQAQPVGSDDAVPELDTAPPPLRTDRLIPVDVPRTGMRYGVDPDSVSLGADRIVRYVVVARSETGAVNAIYEGIRCHTGEVKVYARHSPDSGWQPASASAWKPLQGNIARHSLIVARTGACVGGGANGSAAQIVRDLRAPVDTRFNTN